MIARLRAAFRPFFMVTSPQILRAKSEALQPRLSSFCCMLWTRAGPAGGTLSAAGRGWNPTGISPIIAALRLGPSWLGPRARQCCSVVSTDCRAPEPGHCVQRT